MHQLKTIFQNYLQKSSRLKRLSDLLFICAIGLSLYTLISTWMVRASLPEGVCPINTNIKLYYFSIALLIVSFFVSIFDHRHIDK